MRKKPDNINTDLKAIYMYKKKKLISLIISNLFYRMESKTYNFIYY